MATHHQDLIPDFATLSHKNESVVKTFKQNPRKSWGFSFERGKSG